MIIIGFLIYGPVMLIGLHALKPAPKSGGYGGAGFTGLFGYPAVLSLQAPLWVIPLDFGWGWRLYGDDWRHSGGNPAGGRDDWRKRHHDELQLKRNGG